MRSSSIFLCIMKMVSHVMIFFILQIFILNFFVLQIQQVLVFSCDSCCSLVNNFIFFFLKLIIFIVCSFKDSQYFFIQSLPLYTLCLYSMLLNDDVLDIENLMEHVRLLLLWINFQNCFYIHQSFLLNIQDMYR